MVSYEMSTAIAIANGVWRTLAQWPKRSFDTQGYHFGGNMAWTQDNQDALEKLVDTTSLGDVVGMLEAICGDKADHLCSNWQDKEAARSWVADGETLRRVYTKLNNK